MSYINTIKGLIGCAALSITFSNAHAQETIKIGVIAPFSGPMADYGRRIHNGIKAYLKVNGDTVAGKKVEIIVRDTTGPLPDVAKRLAQELLARDKVDFLAGFGFTPEALAVAPLVTQAKKPMIIMNAAASIITTKSPYIARVSFTLAQISAPLGEWAAKNGVKKVYTVVSDYVPGVDAEEAFKKAFIAQGGEIVGSLRVPLQNPELAPFVQRVKDAKPDAVFVFVPGGDQIIGFMKAFNERGLARSGTKVLLASELPMEVLQAMGNAALSMIVSTQYLQERETIENKTFLKAYSSVSGDYELPTAYSVAAYDGMAAIYEVARKLNGQIDGDKAMAVLKGMKINSPRGPIQIDPDNRDVVQTIYIGRVQRKGGKNSIVEIARFTDFKDPGKK
ncbi:MAG TPA: ABC transporter substrate-binding protein [Oxalobacteraceae bacterium]|nr:ABC transporter substrate-binding protein [Oxalobacteraceae bacterium]